MFLKYAINFYTLYQEVLKYDVTEDLKFIILVDEDINDYTIANDIISIEDNSILSMDRNAYDASIKLSTMLLKKSETLF